MSTRFADYKEAFAEATAKADKFRLDVAIRAVKEYGKLGYNVSFASKNDSDYTRAEIVKPQSGSVNQNPKRKCPGSCGDTWPSSELCIRCGKCFYCCEHPEPLRDKPEIPDRQAS